MENIIKNINILELKDKFNYKKIKDLISKEKLPVVFSHSDTDLSLVNKKTNIILSPAYYWCKKEDLEIDSLRKAKKLTESIFFGSLPDGNFSYKATKIDSEFFFFAYDKEKIFKELLSQGLKKEFIGNVYFAQNECSSDRVCKISDKFALIHQNTMVSIMPLQYAQEPKDFDTLDIELSNTYFKYKNTVNSEDKNLLIPTVFVAIWLVLEILQGYHLGDKLNKLEDQKADLYKTYKLPATSFQRKSIKSKYTKIAKSQNKIRQIFTDLTSYPTTKDDYFEEIALNKKEIKAIFVYSNPDSLETLKQKITDGDFTQTETTIEIRFKL